MAPARTAPRPAGRFRIRLADVVHCSGVCLEVCSERAEGTVDGLENRQESPMAGTAYSHISAGVLTELPENIG
jgi:hypothetical protein